MSHDLMWPGMTLGAALIVLLAAHIRQINGRLRQQVAGRKRADDLLADLQAEKALGGACHPDDASTGPASCR